jgi:TonB family protein
MKRRSVLATLVATCFLVAATLIHAEGRQLKKKFAPEYPVLALKMHVQGQVTVEATIDSDGTVTDVKAVSGHELLRPAALACVKRWQYEPASGKTVEMVGVSFTLP